ncbi:MAG: hypothetical protein LJE69_17650 [Thiohalocapsa sp.]|jgi:hypothetical protein|uniref:hypothetical protein n=1 Tax=Thiohalocapsa sp. TaxID=2497641 RepID=UPI0025EE64B5|nr:hypothetical protein [Thiohalocapsa sp.]MCG6943059.1 hypothetical protein [Thiohalocapsa sp.]
MLASTKRSAKTFLEFGELVLTHQWLSNGLPPCERGNPLTEKGLASGSTTRLRRRLTDMPVLAHLCKAHRLHPP